MSRFTLPKGILVKDISGISEGYTITQKKEYYMITINVSAENIDRLFRLISQQIGEPGFYFSNMVQIRKLKKKFVNPLMILCIKMFFILMD